MSKYRATCEWCDVELWEDNTPFDVDRPQDVEKDIGFWHWHKDRELVQLCRPCERERLKPFYGATVIRSKPPVEGGPKSFPAK